MRCPSCQRENAPDARFCGRCGHALALTCPSCGRPNPPDARFCDACGKPFAAPSVPVERSLQGYPKSAVEASQLEAERRQLTVMFCDLVGSTEMAQKLDPEQLAEVDGCRPRCPCS